MKAGAIDMAGPDLNSFCFLAERGGYGNYLTELLSRPCRAPWGDLSREGFARVFERLKGCLEDERGLLELLELNLITGLLVKEGQAPSWFRPWISEHIPVERYFPDMGWDTVCSGRWHAAPVFLVRGSGVYMRYFVSGLVDLTAQGAGGIPPWPGWAGDLMDGAARSAVLAAGKASSRIHPPPAGRRLYIYPLTLPNGQVQFAGGSLGLPVALGFLRALAGGESGPGPAATGSIDERGNIGGVQGLSLKVPEAGRAGFKAFMLPDSDPGPRIRSGVEILPVSDLGEAWMFDTLYRPGNGRKLILMAEMLRDPSMLKDNCRQVPVPWLRWAKRVGLTGPVMDGMLKSKDIFDGFVRKVDACLARGDTKRAETLARLVDADRVKALRAVAPQALFKWLTLNLAMANHRGDVEAAGRWERRARSMIDSARVMDVEELASFYNHRFIRRRHTRYIFEPRLPGLFEDLLDTLEDQYRSSRRITGNATHETLGAVCGTIAQNYGFCGPAYLDQTEKYCSRAGDAFGGGEVPELREDWFRQFNYLTYALLDAGRHGRAGGTLMKYLEAKTWEELRSGLSRRSRWQHATLARFLADTEKVDETRRYADWALEKGNDMVRREHPWQLWLHNMGRISLLLEDERSAVKYWRRSLDSCLFRGRGPAIRVMALLPLSGLWKVDAFSGLETEAVEKEIRDCAWGLNPDHFRPVLDEPDFEKALETVWDAPGELFPFTYR